MCLSRSNTDTDRRSPIPLKSATETKLSNLPRVFEISTETTVALKVVIEKSLCLVLIGSTSDQANSFLFPDDFKFLQNDFFHGSWPAPTGSGMAPT
jgi:hypothetical protein